MCPCPQAVRHPTAPLGRTKPAYCRHNIEAEQQLLGAILSSNDVLDRVEDLVKPDHFFDPVHREIFQLASARIAKGLATDATTMKNFVADIAGLKDLGGAEYLVKLQLSAIATSAARDYAQLIHDLAVRRALIGLGATISDRARAMRDDVSPDQQIVEAETDLFKLASTGKTSSGFKSFLSALHEAVTTANAAHKRQGKLAGLSTGLTDMDRMLGGLHKSDLPDPRRAPSMGKTSLATNIAFNVARIWKGRTPRGRIGRHGRWRRRGLLQPGDVVVPAGAAESCRRPQKSRRS